MPKGQKRRSTKYCALTAPPVKKAIKKTKKTTRSCLTKKYSTFWTEDRDKLFKKNCKKLKNLENVELKKILKENNQSQSGNKSQLIAKVADGMLFGAIPRCERCGAGRPKFDISTGIYFCDGYQDDDEWKNCKVSYDFDELKRLKWEMDDITTDEEDD